MAEPLLRKLTRAEKTTLVGLIADAIADGSYYGPRKQYYARLRRLLIWAHLL